MSSSRLLAGPELSRLESAAFEAIGSEIDHHPDAILYLTENPIQTGVTTDRWKEFGAAAVLRQETVDRFVSNCFERGQYQGQVTHVDRPLLLRLVELGIEGTDASSNPLNTGSRLPGEGLVQEAESLFTDLEFAGHLTPAAMRRTLEEIGLPDRAEAIGELAEGIEDARSNLPEKELGETFYTERVAHVANEGSPLHRLYPAVEAVIVRDFRRFDRLERQLLNRISETWPVVALMPMLSDLTDPKGPDVATEDALATYRDIGLDSVYIEESETAATAARRRVVRGMYRHPDDAPDLASIEPETLNLKFNEPETVTEEIRGVARETRSILADGAEAVRIGIVLTNPQSYREQVEELCNEFDIPATIQVDTSLSKTLVGQVVREICELSREPRTVDSVLNLLTNPLVTLGETTNKVDHQEIAEISRRVETTHIDATIEHLNGPVAEGIVTLVDEAISLRETSLEDLPERLDAMFEDLGVTTEFENGNGLPDEIANRELRAREQLNRVLETLALTDSLADTDIGDTVERLERALHGITIHTGRDHRSDEVVICDLTEANQYDFDQTFVLGLTSSHFPSDPEPLEFRRPIYEAHPDLTLDDKTAAARYHFAILLASESSVFLSSPQRGEAGESYVEADVVTELRRLVDFDEITIEAGLTAPGSPEDIQQLLGIHLAQTSVDEVNDLVDEAVGAGTYTASQADRYKAGMASGAARSSSILTPYDGQLSPELVSRIHPEWAREPFSASRLETYAACGFKYYMKHVLDIEAPDPLTKEPDGGTRGSYIHDVLEHFYRSLQDEHGDPVHPGRDFDARQDQLLAIAIDRLDDAFGDYQATTFQADWLKKVLAGLGDPAVNPHYGPNETTEDGHPVARGLFYRFLEHEFDEPARTTARPSWFEARIGEPHHGGTSIQVDPAEIETPDGPVEIHGLIDRIDIVPGTDPTQLIVRDYKTGRSTPSEADGLLGLKLQLPLYALLAEDALDGVETVGGAYYQIRPPNSVNSRSGQITSQEMASYYDSEQVDTPLLRYAYPVFETHDAFRRFIEETTPDRIGTLTNGISSGLYQPTVLDAADAGCRYCDYAHVCDVRHHERRDVIDHVDNGGPEVYVPPKARRLDPEDALEVE